MIYQVLDRIEIILDLVGGKKRVGFVKVRYRYNIYPLLGYHLILDQ